MIIRASVTISRTLPRGHNWNWMGAFSKIHYKFLLNFKGICAAVLKLRWLQIMSLCNRIPFYLSVHVLNFCCKATEMYAEGLHISSIVMATCLIKSHLARLEKKTNASRVW